MRSKYDIFFPGMYDQHPGHVLAPANRITGYGRSALAVPPSHNVARAKLHVGSHMLSSSGCTWGLLGEWWPDLARHMKEMSNCGLSLAPPDKQGSLVG